MTVPRRALLIAVALLCLFPALSCRRFPPGLLSDPANGPFVGHYKGRLEEQGKRTRQFRLLLFAALPDRVHAEVLSPVGTTQLILDGGGGNLAITFVPDGLSFVGEARPEALERILGISMTLEELVRGVMTGEGDGPGTSWTRRGGQRPGLPEALEIRTPSASLRLELKRLRSLVGPEAELGRGRPPRQTRVRPIEELAGEGPRVEQLIDGEPG